MSDARLECTNCHYWNESGSKFCGQCGSVLEAGHPSVAEQVEDLKLKKSKYPVGIIVGQLLIAFAIIGMIYSAIG